MIVWALIVLVAVWGLAAATLPKVSPRAGWLLVGYPLAWWRMMVSWRRVCVRLGWTEQRRGGGIAIGGMIVQGREIRPRVPVLRVGRPGLNGITARVKMLAGQQPSDYDPGLVPLAHAWRVHSVRVQSPERGWIRFTAMATDPLGRGIGLGPAGDVPAPGDLVVIPGLIETGEPWRFDLRVNPHYLVVGATQSGKSTLLQVLVDRFAPLRVALVGIDLKGGLELGPYSARLSGLATTVKEAAAVLVEVVGLMLERMEECRAAGVKAVWALPEPPAPVIVIIDEIAELYLGGPSEKDAQAQASTALLRIAQLGAALDVHLIVAAQRFGSDTGPGVTTLRAQLTGRVCLRVADKGTAEMAIGDVAPDAVEIVLMITPLMRGSGVTVIDGAAVRVRSAMTTVEATQAVTVQYADMAVTLPGLDRPPLPAGVDRLQLPAGAGGGS